MSIEPSKLSILGRAALKYAARNWPAFPLWGIVNGSCECPKGATCGKNSGKHPRISGGFHAATTDPKQITDWWRTWPNANIGLAVEPAGLLVLDVDTPGNGHGEADGPATLARLENEHGPLPPTPEALTGSGGRHVYFLAPDGVDLQPKTGIASGLDVRCAGSYIVAPPSAHYLGGVYAWVKGRAPRDLDVAPTPAWLVDLARRNGSTPRPGATPTTPDTGGPALVQGQRNAGLARLAGKVRAAGATPDEVEAAVLAFNALRCKPPLHDDEARGIARSVARYEAGAEDKDDGPAPWPVLAPEAFYGPAGELVQLLDPVTEADPVGVLVTFLAMVGSSIGRGAWYPAGAESHRCNLVVALLGRTAGGRKGTAWGAAKWAMARIDESWMRDNVTGGLGSGEGLIQDVRDPTPEQTRTGSNGKPVKIPGDPGVTDKRRMVYEPELVRVLAVTKREGGILAPTFRDAFDGVTLRNKVKVNSMVATNPHVSLVGHAAPRELVRHVTEGDIAGGLVNRIAWFLVRRKRAIPLPPPMPEAELADFAERVQRALALARNAGPVHLSPAGRDLWCEVYGALSDPSGPLEDHLARGHVHVLRFALVYALLDEVRSIDVPHLRAALALWRYAEASVYRVFGSAGGDNLPRKVADLLTQAGPAGLPRSDLIRACRVPAQRLDAAIAELEAGNRIGRRIDDATGGRARTVFYLLTPGGKKEVGEEWPPVQGCDTSALPSFTGSKVDAPPSFTGKKGTGGEARDGLPCDTSLTSFLPEGCNAATVAGTADDLPPLDVYADEVNRLDGVEEVPDDLVDKALRASTPAGTP